MTRKLTASEYERLFASLRNLVDQAEEAYRTGSLELARHATANLTFATQLIHFSLGTSTPKLSRLQASH